MRPPKVLNTIMLSVFCEFIIAIINSIMFFIVCINKAIICSKTICKNIGVRFYFGLNYWAKCNCRTILDNLNIYFIFSFNRTKNNMFSFRSTPSNSSNSSGPKKLSSISISLFLNGLSTVILFQTCLSILLIHGLLTLVISAILLASISKEKYLIISLNLASEILE